MCDWNVFLFKISHTYVILPWFFNVMKGCVITAIFLFIKPIFNTFLLVLETSLCRNLWFSVFISNILKSNENGDERYVKLNKKRINYAKLHNITVPLSC